MSERYARNRQDRAPATVAAFQVRGRFLTALVLRIDRDSPDPAFYAQLDEQLRTTPQFFAGAPMVLDLANAPGLREDGRIGDLLAHLRTRELRVFGVQNAHGMDEALLDRHGLIPVTTGRDAPLPRAAAAAAAASGAAAAADVPPPVQNVVIHAPVRSGQRVMAEHGDLTIIGTVASGAELVAAGNIHVYGTLRGRAMAGCHGDEGAHIFCQNLSAELVAIAGLYQTSETLDAAALQRCTHIYLRDEKLCMEVIA
ncbi:septum site-determining protein MinC [Paracoccus haeundaensis]|uniref:Probable septum site-determining protein MinC n=1 Tax=Paracoccus haeundaensis TaxID=225362 RepID=A0A5C4R943_9RHOB|nr:septum site-determining protein MinC [Paracoccus haeundaensis]TNH40442.1 septum formation inhibitor MinC [Paracoccus haeundaensis]